MHRRGHRIGGRTKEGGRRRGVRTRFTRWKEGGALKERGSARPENKKKLQTQKEGNGSSTPTRKRSEQGEKCLDGVLQDWTGFAREKSPLGGCGEDVCRQERRRKKLREGEKGMELRGGATTFKIQERPSRWGGKIKGGAGEAGFGFTAGC